MLVRFYTCQNATFLEILCYGSDGVLASLSAVVLIVILIKYVQ